MPKERNGFSVFNDLLELSKESDQLAELAPLTGLDDYFASWRATILKIKTCTSVKDIEYPPSIRTIISGEPKVIKTVHNKIPGRAHLHAEKNVVIGNKTSDVVIGNKTSDIKFEKNQRNSQVIQSKDEDSVFGVSIPISIARKSEAVSLSDVSSKKVNQECTLPDVTITVGSQKLMETPIMNTTFNKLINNTVVLGSASSCEGDFRITRSGSKQVLKNCRTSSSRMLTRSGSKRKSSPSKNESSKKRKEETTSNSVSVSATKANRSKKLLNKNLKINENKSKTSAVIVPTMKHKTVVKSKEKLTIEDIQRKDEKAIENRKKVLAQRQLKAEEQKKKRNEKMEKTLQKRLMMEKEKEERLEKKENGVKKTQVNSNKESVKNPVLKLRMKEAVDQHLKESNSMNLSTPKQNGANEVTMHKTPARNVSSKDSDTYELTPVPDSSSYDFSDDDDQGKASGKPIPSWAQGTQLRLALAHQYFNPPDTDSIFGSYIETPNLVEIFRVQKQQYLKRTSSAVWKTPPDYSVIKYHK